MPKQQPITAAFGAVQAEDLMEAEPPEASSPSRPCYRLPHSKIKDHRSKFKDQPNVFSSDSSPDRLSDPDDFFGVFAGF
uniref:Uncharacterized protein n=1 Tax=Pristionchus pacificus TaxID=54126 RepID=A0A2A6CIE2_PRIPA|eukprot:PDM77876.1 hypothetical protein PRIPAC_34743 [Pristionchus pacificus]